MKRLLLCAAAAVGFVAPTLAADLPPRTKPPAMADPAPNWSGFTIGVNGGGAWGRTNTGLNAANDPIGFYDPDNIAGVNAAGSNRIKTSGGVVGGQVGYIWQSGNAIFGVEGAFDWTGLKGSSTNTQTYFDNPAQFTINENTSSDFLATFLGRAGYDMGAWYPYLTAGLAVTDHKYGFDYTDVTFASKCSCAATFHQTEPGFAGGAGLALKLSGNWSIRGEYLYLAFANVTGSSRIGGTPPSFDFGTAAFSHTAKFSESIARIALDYRFGGPGF